MKKWILMFLMVLLSSLTGIAQANSELKSEELKLFAKNVIIPLPSEVFLALDQVAEVDWKKSAAYNYSSDYAENHILALNLGVRVADGFVAIQAQDKVNASSMFSVCRDLADSFGAKNGNMINKKALLESINIGNWYQLRQMLDELQLKIKHEMKKYHPDYVILTSVGGWLEGLRVITKNLSESYNSDTSTMLHQPILINYLIKEMEGFSQDHLRNKLIQKVYAQLKEIKHITNVGSGNPVPKKDIKKLYRISQDLVENIVKGA